MKRYTSLAISDPAELCFGTAPSPLRTRKGLILGGGVVYPEINFTLPPMLVNAETMPRVREEYRQMIREICQRAVVLEAPGLVVEFETLPPMTENPAWAIEITKILLERMEETHAKHGLPSVLRITPNDTREMVRPPVMRSGELWENMVRAFEGCAEAGAELLSIESVGGKEVCDEALTYGDIRGVIFGLCVMGVRDMRFLWDAIARIAREKGVHAAGDTACGFANTALSMAEQNLIPRVFAAVVRAVSAVRSLVAYECGAVGPGKDCGYENPILKAITGYPMAMEGKSAACAHFSSLGNIAGATCDTWSNESVQNVRLLAGNAPTCSLEQLVYDCRLMNQAIASGPSGAGMLRDWMVQSDALLDPQAYILTPHSVILLARAIVGEPDAYRAGVAAARTAIALIRQGMNEVGLKVAEKEVPWLDRMEEDLDSIPDREDTFIREMMGVVDQTRFVAKDYALA